MVQINNNNKRGKTKTETQTKQNNKEKLRDRLSEPRAENGISKTRSTHQVPTLHN